jgi:hypothetical protein
MITRREFRTTNEKVRKDIHIESIKEMKNNFMNISEQLGMVANLKQNYLQVSKDPIKHRRNRTTFYMNNFVKIRYPRQLKDSPNEERKK